MTGDKAARYATPTLSKVGTDVAANPKQSEVMQQIQQAFQEAEARLTQLREAVEHNTDLARAHARATLLKDRKEQALKELGEAVWRAVQKGKLELPASLAPALQGVKAAEQAVDDYARELLDILREGEEVAARLKGGKNATRPQTVVASGTKKR